MRTKLSETNAVQFRTAIVGAWGGVERWRDARRIEAILHTGGWAFRMRGRRSVRDVRVALDVHSFRVRLENFPGTGRTAEIGRDFLRLGGCDCPPRSVHALRTGRRRIFWDTGDFAYFVGYAIWNYLTLPAILLRDDAKWKLSSGAARGRDHLSAVFPEDFPTHCREQEFYFDATGGLLRHDYTARAFGDFARAANIPIETSSADGFRWVRRRAVYPRAAYVRGIRAPVLVDVEVPEFRVF